MKLTNDKVKELKEDFPILKEDIVYLDNGATTQKPLHVIEAVSNYYKKENANVHRGVYKLSEEATRKYEESKEIVANFINSKPEEIIYTRNSTESLNLLAYTLPSIIKDKNEIVLTEMEHHSNLIPWQQLAKRNNFKIKFIKLKNDFTLDYEDAKQKITNKTAILSIVHISNVLGTINDIKTLIKLGREKSAITIIDAAQSIGHKKINVKELNCDFLVFSAHKMLGPTGLGVLYGKKELLEKLSPFNFGGDMIKRVSYEDAEWNDLPMKFEAGTPNIADAIGLAEAVKYLQSISMQSIEEWEKELLKYAIKRLKEINSIEIYNPGIDKSSGIISFNIKNIHPHDIASILDDENICIRAGHHCAMPLMNKLNIIGTCRISFYFYNTFEDIDKLVDGLKKVKEIFKIAEVKKIKH